MSLLRSQEQPDGEPRFSMLETIRDYAGEQLEQRGEAHELRNRHAGWIGSWLERRAKQRGDGRLIGNWEPEDEEHDNARAALGWARESGDIDRELQLAACAGRFYWPNRGLLTEGRRWLDDVLERSEGADERWRAFTMLAAAHHAWRQGDYDRCEEVAAEAQPVFERLNDREALGATLIARAIAAEHRLDLEAEAAFYEVAEKLFRELDNRPALESILNNRAYAEILVGNFESAERRLRELVGTAAGFPRLFALANHGVALTWLGRIDEAAACFGEVLRAPDSSEVGEIQFYAIEGLATVAGKREDDVRAARLWGASAAIREAMGYALAGAEQRLHDEIETEVRSRLDEQAFDRAWNEGHGLSPDQAAELALMDP
jgi:tetratricopeptide (TPR) repeat protein